jgi:polyisoprenyl-teichoic acid--peptidoglycan teichoic acid transferase
MYERKRYEVWLSTAVLTIIVFCILILAGFYVHIRNNIYKNDGGNKLSSQENFHENYTEAVPSREEAPENLYEFKNGITNILLIGTDTRDLKENARADSIIIATIDSNNRKLKFTSIMRDTYVAIKNHSAQKINNAFAYGGPELLMDTIGRNFNLQLDKYIVINFHGFEDMIDALGGIEVDIKEYEIKEINKYIGELRGKKSPMIRRSGLQLLDGQQALAYSRIRKVGNGSYERTLRQRRVLTVLTQKLKTESAFNYPVLLSRLLPCMKTNIEPINLLNYGYTVSRIKPLEVAQLQIPVTELSEGRIYKGTWVMLMDAEQNSRVMNDFIFKDRVTTIEELDIKAFRIKLKEYLRAEMKINPRRQQGERTSRKELEKRDRIRIIDNY